MILFWLIGIPFVAGIVAWVAGRSSDRWPRWLALAAMAADLALVLAVWVAHPGQIALSSRGPLLAEVDYPWISQVGIGFHLEMDGLSLILIALTAFLGIMSVAASWTEIQERVGLFHFMLLWVLAAIIAVFLALDLFLFYFFWELMLVPMYFLIAVWGHERRTYAAIKFFLFTQLSGLLMFVAILALYFIHAHATGVRTFDYFQLLGTPMAAGMAMVLMLGFLAAFLVKLPAVPLHTWLPDAHTEAPTAGSVILAGLLLKTGAYGLLRFVVPLFPHAALDFRPVAMALAVAGILYGALLAFGQLDLKRLVAYTSVSHMGFVLLGVFAWNRLALEGVILQIVCHGLATGGLFILVGALQERTHTRDIRHLSGLWAAMPRMGGVAMVLVLAALGLPGLGNFLGEFLVLLGTYRQSILFTVLAALGLVSATVYALWLIQTAFHGPNQEGWQLPDFSFREMGTAAALIVALLWLGLYPQPVFNVADPALARLEQTVAAGYTAAQARPHQASLPILGESGSRPLSPEGTR